MKRVEKEFTFTEIRIKYEAVDGTTFDDKEECEKYEKSALGLMMTKIKPLMSEPKESWTTMGGIDDHQVVAVSMKDEKDLDAVIQWFFLENPWYLSEGREERKEEIISIISNAFTNKDVVLFGINCDGEYYFINSRQNIINNLNNLDKKESND